ncbi:MAG: hypothetical protein KTR25_10950 [Myxococcales bacterium]|nr:hypothetical protein [Myxococcales bacterium]
MIVIINGPCGIGKSSTSWALNELFERSVMLDGDFIGAVHPFEIYDDQRITYLYRTLAHLIRFHRHEGGYTHFVINYVFESADSLAELKAEVGAIDPEVYAFRLIAEDAAVELRIRGRERDSDEVARQLNRYRELVAIQNEGAQCGDLGTIVDTTGVTVQEVAQRIKHSLDQSTN